MSILTNSGTLNSSELDRSSPGGYATSPQSSYRLPPVRREDEPLEEAFEDTEAPESGARIDLEAPDAGEGSLYHDDREFKHGRSRG
jgi:hypothetical protein